MKKISFKEPISKIMTEHVHTVNVDTPAAEVRKIFMVNKFHHLPVVDEAGLIKGMISSLDLFKIARWLEVWQLTSKPLSAADIMTAYPFTLSPDDPIGIAVDLFLENRFHALPIVDGDKLIGIITTHDILSLTREYAEILIDN